MADKPTQQREPMRITRVYTRMGDAGKTQLVGGREVPKDDPRLAAYGTVDELQVAIGLARDALRATLPALSETPRARLCRLIEHLIYLQNLLFTLSGELATRFDDRWDGMPLTRPADVTFLESLIDHCNAELPPLKDFILMGGHWAVTALHECRVVARRAEREIETLAGREPIGESIRPFMNRLSDLFFVLARFVAAEFRRHGVAPREMIWERDRQPPPMP